MTGITLATPNASPAPPMKKGRKTLGSFSKQHKAMTTSPLL
ncbi:hypothetical protein R3I94_008758 [Phoxinus phoxinus]